MADNQPAPSPRPKPPGMTVEGMGRLMSYAIMGVPFEKYLAEQPEGRENEAEAREYYDDTIRTQKEAAAAGGEVRPLSDW